MSRRIPEIGMRSTVRRRLGMDFPQLGGMHLNGDPSQVPPNAFRHLENIRFNAGGGAGARNRGSIISGPEHGVAGRSMHTLCDFQTSPRILFMTSDGCPGTASAAGQTLSWFDWEQEKSGGSGLTSHFTTGVWYDAATTSCIIAVYDGRLYIGVDATLKAFNLVIPPNYSADMSMIGGAEQAEDIATFTGFIITCLQEYDGKLFIGLDAGAGASKIATWDGLTIRDDLTAINAPSCFGVWRDKLVFGYPAAGGIQYRQLGPSPGTWAAVAAGGGHPSSFQMLSYRDVLYIASGSTGIYAWSGAAITAARTIAGCAIWSLCEFHGAAPTHAPPLVTDDYLIYGYRDAGGAGAFGGYCATTTTWEDTIGTFHAGSVNPYCCISYRGTLFFGVTNTVHGAILAVSVQENMSDTTGYGPISGVAWPGSINQFVVM